MFKSRRFLFLLTLALVQLAATSAQAWWDKEWVMRKKLTVDTSAVSGAIGGATVLVRLHDGNFQFGAAKEDGADIRFVAEDDKTVLSYHIEKYDPLMNEAFLWVKLPEVKAGGKTDLWLYYGSNGAKATRVGDPKQSWDPATLLVYHFAERNAPPADSSGKGHNATDAGVSVEGSLIGPGARLGGPKPISLPDAPELAWQAGGAMTWSAWLKASSLVPQGVIFQRGQGAQAFVIGEDNGVPYVSVSGQRSSPAAPVAPNAWHHLAVVAEGGRVALYLNGEMYGSVGTGLPALTGPATLGAATNSFAGEMDELQIANAARTTGWIKLSQLTQGGGDGAARTLQFGADEGGGDLLGDGDFAIIIKNLTVDGWIVIVILAFMLVVSWWLMFSKVSYLNALAKGNAMFMKEWRHLSADLTALDDGDAEKVRTLGGRVMDKKGQKNLRQSSVYRIYHVGAEEIRHRVVNSRSGRVLSARSIQAIRAALDGTQVREKQRIDSLIVLLTICISGGPFLGLLGTVVGVMITFAAVAKAGDVNVNAIAPGIAAALLATVAGLAVAIPALFGYNYSLARVKDATADMHVFIDEFVAKMAEFYSETEPPVQRSTSPAKGGRPEMARELETAAH